MMIAEAIRKWGAGWANLSPELQAGAVALAALRTVATRPPEPGEPAEITILREVWASAIVPALEGDL